MINWGGVEDSKDMKESEHLFSSDVNINSGHLTR